MHIGGVLAGSLPNGQRAKQPLRASSSSVTVAASAARVSAPVALGRRHGVPLHPPDYGRLNEPVRDAMAMAARLEAMLLDPVYSGKAMAGLIAHVRSGRIAAGSRVLFIHTGGQPAIFAYAEKLGPWLAHPAGTPGD